jgi:hypothetical protein
MNTTGLSHINRFEEFALFVASIFMLLSEGRLSKAEVYLSEYILRPPDNGVADARQRVFRRERGSRLLPFCDHGCSECWPLEA